jgi:hypothetical protein
MGLCQSNTSKNNSQPTRGYRIVNLTNHAEDNKRYFVVEKSRGYGAGGFEELMNGFNWCCGRPSVKREENKNRG